MDTPFDITQKPLSVAGHQMNYRIARKTPS